ncbi:MAG: SDR family NAD(P)-dependent oxidoreductase [Anaerolineales bacterium]
MAAEMTLSPALVRQRAAIIVGASSGIGAALARRLGREGYGLALLGRRAEALADVCAQINSPAGPAGRARAYPHDVTDGGEVPGLFQTILRDLGRVDLVVYCAARQTAVGLQEYDFDKDRAMLDTNLLGAVAWLNQAAVLFERVGAGQIAAISSIAGERGRVGSPVYNTSKAGLNTYVEALRNRLTRRGVNVLTVRPGFVDTELLKNAAKPFWVISPEQAADDIWRAIRGRKQMVYTPARWRLVVLVIRHIPSVIFRRMSF